MRRMLPRRTSLAHSSEVAHMEIRRGDIYYADLTPVVGCEQGGRRPVLVIQNDVGNHHGEEEENGGCPPISGCPGCPQG